VRRVQGDEEALRPDLRRIQKAKRGREAHPLLESCRSVYSYEVRFLLLLPFSSLRSPHAALLDPSETVL
jgi:hypothetical protein